MQVSGTMTVGEITFVGKPRQVETYIEINRYVKELEYTLLTELAVDIEAYEQWKTPCFMTTTEAAERWGLKRNTLIASLTRGRFEDQKQNGLIRTFNPKHGKRVYYISELAMNEVYGKELIP